MIRCWNYTEPEIPFRQAEEIKSLIRHIFLTLKPYLSYVYTFPLISHLSLITRHCVVTRSVTLSCSYPLLICQILNCSLFWFVPRTMTEYLNYLSIYSALVRIATFLASSCCSLGRTCTLCSLVYNSAQYLFQHSFLKS